MNEERKEKDLENMEVRCDLCRKVFPYSEADKRCPDCKIGVIRWMEKAA